MSGKYIAIDVSRKAFVVGEITMEIGDCFENNRQFNLDGSEMIGDFINGDLQVML